MVGFLIGCGNTITSGWDTTTITFGKIMVVAFGIIINVVFGIITVIVVVVVVNGEGPTLRPIGIIRDFR